MLDVTTFRLSHASLSGNSQQVSLNPKRLTLVWDWTQDGKKRSIQLTRDLHLTLDLHQLQTVEEHDIKELSHPKQCYLQPSCSPPAAPLQPCSAAL